MAKVGFKKENEHWKTVKDFHLDKPILLKVLVVSAKCLNPHCKIKSFPLPVKGVTKYQRATDRVIKAGFPELAKRVWCYRRTFLKHPKRYTEKDKEIMDEIILSYEQELPTNILVLKDRIRDIFENSLSQNEAYKKKNKLYFEDWHKKNRHFKKIIKHL